jgi:hypothetical protein
MQVHPENVDSGFAAIYLLYNNSIIRKRKGSFWFLAVHLHLIYEEAETNQLLFKFDL